MIVDYSLEDVRALHKRDKRIERQRQTNEEKKKEARREAKKEGKEEKEVQIGSVVELGKRKNHEGGKKEDVISIDKITD